MDVNSKNDLLILKSRKKSYICKLWLKISNMEKIISMGTRGEMENKAKIIEKI